MSFTKNIDRKYAEAARARARILSGVEGPLGGCAPRHEAEHRECVAIWNQFCAEETARIERTGDANAYIKPRTYAAILPGVFVETIDRCHRHGHPGGWQGCASCLQAGWRR